MLCCLLQLETVSCAEHKHTVLYGLQFEEILLNACKSDVVACVNYYVHILKRETNWYREVYLLDCRIEVDVVLLRRIGNKLVIIALSEVCLGIRNGCIL